MSVFFEVFDDLFADHFAFETTKRRFDRLVCIDGYKSHYSLTPSRPKDLARRQTINIIPKPVKWQVLKSKCGRPMGSDGRDNRIGKAVGIAEK